MFHSSQCLFYVFTFYFKCLFIWHRQRALKNADKQRLGSIFICTWSQGEERKKKNTPQPYAEPISSTLSLTHVLLCGECILADAGVARVK